MRRTPASEATRELARWYLGSLRPKVLRAAREGAIPPARVAELERLLSGLLRGSPRTAGRPKSVQARSPLGSLFGSRAEQARTHSSPVHGRR
jgi:hypothetical protein